MSRNDEIPVFKTALQPRKRAKTSEEKEQRRLERIIRNRNTAHASRERKKRYLQSLEKMTANLQAKLELVESLNQLLLNQYNGNNLEINKLVFKVKSFPEVENVLQDYYQWEDKYMEDPINEKTSETEKVVVNENEGKNKRIYTTEKCLRGSPTGNLIKKQLQYETKNLFVASDSSAGFQGLTTNNSDSTPKTSQLYQEYEKKAKNGTSVKSLHGSLSKSPKSAFYLPPTSL